MALTVKGVLEMAPFVACGARVLTGTDAADRPVRWVHCSEMPEAARLFRGDELLLTQGRGLSLSEDDQFQWVDDLADAGVAGVALELGVILDEVPSAVVERARIRGLIVIAMRHPAYFMAMTQAVHGAIVNSQYDALRRAEEIGRRFSRLALAGAGPQTIIDHLSSVISRPTVLADSLHQVKAVSPNDEPTVHRIANWSAHARQEHDYVDSHDGTEHVDSGGLQCVCQSIVFRGELWGSVHVLRDGFEVLDELSTLALDRAVAAIGLAFAAAEGEQRQDDDVRSALLQDLLRGRSESRAQIRERAMALGVELSTDLRVAICRPVEMADGTRPRNTNTREVRSALRVLAASLNRTIQQSWPSGLVGYSGSRVLAIFSAASDEGAVQHAFDRLAHSGSGQSDRVEFILGVSGLAQLETLPRAAADAEDAVQYALRTGRGAGVILSTCLGIDRLLLKLDETSALTDHIERELGAVLNHDAGSNAPLLPTLTTYLELAGRGTNVAKRLHIERRSLYHRLERISPHISGDLDDADTRLRLLVAIRGLAYLERSAPSRGPRNEV